MRQIITIIILTLTTGCCLGQYLSNSLKISNQTKEVIAKITAINEVTGSAVSEGGTRSEQYDNFIELQKTATKAELTALTAHPNGVVRCYAIWALSYDTTVNLLPIVVRHLNDTALVHTLFGCIGGHESVGDFFIDVVTQSIDLDSKQLTAAEHEYLDSVLIYMPNTLNARDWALERVKLTESSYARVKELVLKENSQSALVVLAKFRRKEDIPLILKNRLVEQNQGLFYTFKAICEFPDPAFRSLLIESLHNELNHTTTGAGTRGLYDAIASFKDDTAYQLLKAPFTELKNQHLREYHINYVFGAVRNYYSPVYADLLWEMWENEKKISPDVFTLLYRQHPERAFQLTKKTIQHADDFYYLSNMDYNEDEGKSTDLLDIMLDTVLARDRTLAVELINKSIYDVNVHLFGTCADKVLKLRDESCVKALLARLEKDDNPNIYLKAAAVLIALNSNDINKQVVAASKRNTNIRTGWGKEAFARLLKENDIN